MQRIAGLLIALTAVILTGCGGGDGDTTTPIAIVGPITGQYASFGAQMKNGGDMAVADINAAGGVLGKKLDLSTGDDACDPKQAVAVANQMTGAGVKLVAGHYCSGSSIPASKVYAESDMVQISPASTNPTLTDDRAGPNIYRVCGRDDQQGGVAGKYLASHLGDKKIAFVQDKTAYGKGLADETKKAMNAAGKQEEMYEAITAGEKDYSALVSKLKQANIDVVYFGGYHTEAGLIIRQMRDQGLQTILMGGDALITQEFWSITGDAGEGTLMTFSPDPRKNPAAAEVVKRFKDKGIEPEGYVLYTYAALQAWKQAAEKAKSVERDEIVKALNDTEFDTVIGKFKFNEKGDPNLPPYAVYRWSKGTYEQIDPPASPPAG
ncbi:branched-chain amino acid ABC transporter substrate-binding protein [Methyloceanibacter sp.]|jgi:branched-chain amino acid transport system substrate-binding protein|uniref:branched-chain amino acid ABC transporter substrate-binding protein n=1 Tax=Methyloceanibacter sp. TaxID=1965321 RepID=UPI003C720DF2